LFGVVKKIKILYNMSASKIILLLSIGLALIATGSTAQENEQEKVFDAIIVPGYPFNPNGKMNVIYRMRLHWAYELYTQGIAKNIIVSGSAVHSPYVESEIFALYLMEMGVCSEHLIIESQAEHSLENVFYSLELARELGFEKVAVATDLFQSGMIQFLGKKHNLKVDYLPADIGFVITKRWNSFTGTIDHSQAYVEDFVALKERESKKERMHGTRGNRWVEENCLTLNNPIAY